MGQNDLVIYQNSNGAIDLKLDAKAETIWASQAQLALIFNVTPQNITQHLKTIYEDDELNQSATCKEFLQVQLEGKRKISRKIKKYNLDAVIAVGYKIGSKQGTEFRKWATKTLKSYIIDGYVINPERIEHSKSLFLKSLEDLKLLASTSELVGSSETIDLATQFAKTWFSLDAYDKSDLPQSGGVKQTIDVSSSDLETALLSLRSQLIEKGEATELFAQEKNPGSFTGLFGNVFQSFGGEDVYPTLEEKAAHLLYFVVKNHVFNDGNKRSGAYAFVWFLKEAGLLNTTEISNQALTAITLLVAESDPKQKDRMIGVILLMLGVEK